jgi:hypothetical protein
MMVEDVIVHVRDDIKLDRCKQLRIELVKVRSPQTDLMENEPLLRRFVESEVEPRLRRMGIADIRYDPMGNLYSAHGADTSGRSVMLITNAMNQPQATVTNAYAGDVVNGEPYGLPGEVVLGKGASEQKSNMVAMLIAKAIVSYPISKPRRPAFINADMVFSSGMLPSLATVAFSKSKVCSFRSIGRTIPKRSTPFPPSTRPIFMFHISFCVERDWRVA